MCDEHTVGDKIGDGYVTLFIRTETSRIVLSNRDLY